ncbi:MAG: hypothetical protein ACTSQX_12790 [Candidatus Heimdallarchaeota archaeon]
MECQRRRVRGTEPETIRKGSPKKSRKEHIKRPNKCSTTTEKVLNREK